MHFTSNMVCPTRKNVSATPCPLCCTSYIILIINYSLIGHSRVTKSTNESKTKLNRWCSQLRQFYQQRQAGKKSSLTDEKIGLLKNLDFIFEFDGLSGRYSFQERLKWLKLYKEEHGALFAGLYCDRTEHASYLTLTSLPAGNCDVPQRHEKLGHFVKRLRKEYELHRQGVRKMNPEKIEKLIALGFNWRVRGPRRRTLLIKDEGESEMEDDETEGEEKASKRKRLTPPSDFKMNEPIQSLPEKKAAYSTSHCSMCSTSLPSAKAQCATCQGCYCEDCFDELRHDHAQQCQSCKGPVAVVGGGWNV